MSDEKEIEEVENLEARLLAAGVSINQLVRCYADFLLHLIEGDALSSISSAKLDLMSNYLSKAVTPGVVESSQEQRKGFFVDLWPIERQYRESDPAFANFVRCVICCFGNEEDWEQDDTGEATPLWYFLFYIKKVCPEIKNEFLQYFEGIFSERGLSER
ncbi:hypothetical protein [Pseudomonas sp. B21-021]|uniref:hypothetical protein n=1 Tax=Pseudomonas sp. B21-021 TaxID=2895476 RepID=UPI00215EADCF|nr:hypothetical protein [Pseudomonas sp. B21-021]UVM25626.1 hypothetical protein LOY31_19525 [Pseudomonas sp. B21-021]